MRTSAVRLGAGVLIGAIVAASCSALEPADGGPPDDVGIATDSLDDDSGGSEFADIHDVDCVEEAPSGGDDGIVFTSAHRVIGGELDEACFGEQDPVLVGAWDDLAAITPPGQLTDLTLFAGFEPDGDAETDTLAFVNNVDVDGTRFQMAVNVVEAEADPDELPLTLAHEFTHVFTATQTQLDRTDEAIEDCDTYFNGEGCYLADSLMVGWVREFWDDGLIETVDPFDVTTDDVDARCAADEGFFGPYAATNPEEDFAEAFSAYVFRLEPDNAAQQERLDWIDARAGLTEFRDRADAAGMTPLANNFDLCG